MSSKKITLTPAQEGLLNQLVELESMEALASTAQQFGLECDLAPAQPALEQRIAAERALAEARAVAERAISEAETALGAAVGATREALLSCVSGYTPPIVIGWVDEEFLSQLTLSSSSNREALYELNFAKPYTQEFRTTARHVATTYRASLQAQYRVANLLKLVFEDGKVVGVIGNRHEFSLRQAQALAVWAIDHWRSGTASDRHPPSRAVSHSGERFRAVCFTNRVEIGCQILAKEEITRIAALMGWAGLPKSEGPAAPPPELAKAPARKRRVKEPA